MSQSDAVSPSPQHADPRDACDNCHTALHGHYCHACGQSAHNPLKHVGHAIEEVFESFWHLDGRIFRTLRDLLVPGRVAFNFLKGHRVGYVQPLRLFVILTLFTFFVGKLMLHPADFNAGGSGDSAFAKAQTVAEVEALRSTQVAALERQQQETTTPTATAAFAMAMAAVNTAAAQRTAELTGKAPPATAPDSTSTDSAEQKPVFINYPVNGKPWDPETNPIVLDGWPSFVSNWLNHRLANGQANMERMGPKSELYLQAILTSLPGALFFLMPVFALVLRLAYINRPTGYLEHLVVALYSHCWLMLVLLLTFLVVGITGAIANPVVNAITDWFYALLWLSVPVYLFWMQQRVYGGNLVLTALRYSFIGGVYLFLVIFVVLYAVLAGVSA